MVVKGLFDDGFYMDNCGRSPLLELASEVAEAYQARAQRLLPQSNVRQLATAANAMARRRDFMAQKGEVVPKRLCEGLGHRVPTG